MNGFQSDFLGKGKSIVNHKNQNQEWLNEVEQNSWQIEILISGGLLITLYYLPDNINEWLAKVVNDTYFTTSYLLVFLMILVLSKALLIGFGINLFLRAMWLASLGVHHAFPDGVKNDFEESADNVNSGSKIHGSKVALLEKLSSLSYSLAILFTVFAVGSMLIFFLCYLLIFEPFFPREVYDNKIFGFTFFAFIFLSSLGAFDFVTRKIFSKNWVFQKVRSIFSFINFTYFFNYEWKVLISNISRWKLYSICFLFFAVAVKLSLNDIAWNSLSSPIENPFDQRKYTEIEQPWLSLQQTEYEEFYKKGEFITGPIIPSEIINSSFLPLFIPYDQWYDSSLPKSLEYHDAFWNPNERSEDVSITQNFYNIQKVINEMFLVHLNSEKVKSSRWYLKEHKLSNQLGFNTNLDIDTLPRGAHVVRVDFVRRIDENQLDTFGLRWIPFWKE